MRVNKEGTGWGSRDKPKWAWWKGSTGCIPARPQKGRVQEVWSVGGSNHKHILSAMKPIQLRQELRHYPAMEE